MGYSGGKEENEKEKKSSRVAGSFSFFGSHRPCRRQQGQLHVTTLSITGDMRRHRLPVVTLHFVLMDIVVN